MEIEKIDQDKSKQTKIETKSEIQLVYEYSNHLKKSVGFDLIQESGPSHIKKFVTDDDQEILDKNLKSFKLGALSCLFNSTAQDCTKSIHQQGFG